MKNLMHLAWAILLFCSCRKVDDLHSPQNPGLNTSAGTASVENLGHLFTGTNVSWKINPMDPNNAPLFTHLPNQEGGYCMVMIDNGKLDGRTPLSAFRFIVADFQTFTSKIVDITTPEGALVTNSVGRIVRTTFGMDKKLYVATEASSTGGGHIIRYDPNTQTATDLGQPFNIGGQHLDIYTMNTGTDGALYGGSFGGDGQVYTFRYDYNTFEVDATPLDNTSRYVVSVSGDSRYTYAVCGKSNWYLYAIDRQTGAKSTLKSCLGNAVSISLDSRTDAPYAHSVATHYKLSGLTCQPLPEYERPSTDRVEYTPYSVGDPSLPLVSWNDADSRVTYLMKNKQSGYIDVSGLYEDVYPITGPAGICGNKIFFSNDKQGVLGAYTAGLGFEKIGSSSMVINSMAIPCGTADQGKIYLGGYPKGLLVEYSTANNWSINLTGLGQTGSGFGSTSSNPAQRGMFQDADASGVNGSMSLLGMVYTKSGYVAGGGNNDRITASSGRELSMGSFRNGTMRNLYLPEFSDYEFQSMCLSKDSNYSFISAVPHSGNVCKIYKYDPVANQVIGTWSLPLWGDMSNTIYAYNSDMLVGTCDNIVYLFDLTSGQIVWTQSVGQSQKIYGMAVAPDNSIYVNHMYRAAMNFKIEKFNLDISDRANIKSAVAGVAEFADADHDEKYKPGAMVVAPGLSPGTTNLYITGLPTLYKVSL